MHYRRVAVGTRITLLALRKFEHAFRFLRGHAVPSPPGTDRLLLYGNLKSVVLERRAMPSARVRRPVNVGRTMSRTVCTENLTPIALLPTRGVSLLRTRHFAAAEAAVSLQLMRIR